MTSHRRFEHELPDLLADLYLETAADYQHDLLRRTVETPQRSAWSFPERWLPMSVTTLGRQTFRPLPWRTIALLAALAVLIAGSLAIYVGTRPRVPAPFGPAANGLVAYAQRGDIFTVDPVSGARRAIVTGPEMDHDPRWSRDGTRLAFIRPSPGGDLLVIVDADGRNQVTMVQPAAEIDSDSVSWSPDGRTIAFSAGDGQGIHVADVRSRAVSTLPAPYLGLEVHWRPPDGRELLFLGGTEADPGLYLFSLDDGTARELPVSDGGTTRIRPVGWTADGQRFAFHMRTSDEAPAETHVVEIATGAEVVIGAEFARLSNDGSRIVGIAAEGPETLCVASTAGGPCTPIGRTSDRPDGTHGEGLQWSPDDKWIISQPFFGGRPVILDPNGAAVEPPAWRLDGAESWQRIAP